MVSVISGLALSVIVGVYRLSILAAVVGALQQIVPGRDDRPFSSGPRAELVNARTLRPTIQGSDIVAEGGFVEACSQEVWWCLGIQKSSAGGAGSRPRVLCRTGLERVDEST